MALLMLRVWKFRVQVKRVYFTWRGDPDGLFVNFYHIQKTGFCCNHGGVPFSLPNWIPNLNLTPFPHFQISFSLSLSLVCVCVFWFETQQIWFLFFDLSYLVTEKMREKLLMNVFSFINQRQLEILSQWVLLQLQYRKKKEEGEKNSFNAICLNC